MDYYWVNPTYIIKYYFFGQAEFKCSYTARLESKTDGFFPDNISLNTQMPIGLVLIS